MTSRRTGILLVLALTAALIWPVTRMGFVLHDDQFEILGNGDLASFDWPSLLRIWSKPDFSGVFIPLNYTFLAILGALSNLLSGAKTAGPPAPGIFHIAGVLLHLVNTVLVYHLILRLLSRRGEGSADHHTRFAVVGALLFAAHPSQVESYSRAGNLTVTLGGFWALLALLSFLRSGDSGQRPSFWGTIAFILFVCGMLTRPTVAALPLMAFFLAWAEGRRSARTLFVQLLPWMVAGVAYSGFTVWLQSGMAVGGNEIPKWSRPVIAADSLLWYVAQTIWPAELSIDHGRVPATVLARPSVWLSVAGMAALGVAAAFSLRTRSLLSVAGGVAFFCMLLPVSGLVPAPTREDFSIVYDRHLYIPLVAAAVSVAGILARSGSGHALTACVAAISVLGMQSRQYQRVWRDSVSLFTHTISANPGSWYAHGQLGTAFLLSGRPEEALPYLAKACELNRKHVEARVNLGLALVNTNRSNEAEAVLREALSLAPENENARNNLTVTLLRREDWTGAEAEARRVLSANPAQPVAAGHLALALAGQGKWDGAVDVALQAIRLSPATATSWMSLSEILWKAGRPEEALKALQQACDLAPERADWRELLESRIADRDNPSPLPTAPKSN